MLPKEYRLTRMKDYEILYKEGYFVASNLVTAMVWKVETEKYPRRNYSTEDLKVGFVVSLKISKSAVARNRVKRQMREVIRLLLKENKLKTGFMIAIMAKKEILWKEYKEIEFSIIDVLKKSRIMR